MNKIAQGGKWQSFITTPLNNSILTMMIADGCNKGVEGGDNKMFYGQ